MLGKVRDWLSLIRIGNSLVIGYAAVVGYLVSGGNSLYTMIFLFISAFLIGSYGNILNDYYDMEIDKVNKPWRPLSKGSISPFQALSVALALSFIGVSLAFMISLVNGLVALSALILLYMYSYRVKRTGLLGNMVIAFLSLLVIVYGGLATSEYMCSFIPGVYAFIIILARELTKGLEDIEGDRLHGVKTLAVIAGSRTAILVSSILFIILIVISPIPYIFINKNILYLTLAIVGVDIPVAYVMYQLIYGSMDPWKATRILKIPLFMGLTAFLVGAIT